MEGFISKRLRRWWQHKRRKGPARRRGSIFYAGERGGITARRWARFQKYGGSGCEDDVIMNRNMKIEAGRLD